MAEDKLDKIDELSQEQVFSMLDFANALSGNSFYNILTPFLVNARMRELNQFPQQADENKLNEALKSPRDSESQLISFGQDFENRNSLYKRLISYSADMLSFDFTYTSNAEFGDYKSKQYQKDLSVLRNFMDIFDFKREFSQVVREMLRNEAFFGVFRLDNARPSIQELSPDPNWSIITGRTSDTLLFSYNFLYFIQPGVDIDFYPSFFRQKFSELFIKNKGIDVYNPALLPELRGESSYIYYVDIPIGVSPWGWCFKFNPEQGARIPYYTALWPDLVLQPLYRSLQKNINMSLAARTIGGEIPLLNPTAKVKDAFAISGDSLGKFLSLMKSAIGDSINALALPLTNLSPIQFDPVNDLYASQTRATLASSGINTNLIFTNPQRTNISETNLSLGVDEQMILRLYRQFNSFVNYHVNLKTEKFKFKVEFEGTLNAPNRTARFDFAQKLSQMGIVLPQKLAASVGMSPFEMQRQQEEARAMGYVDTLTPIILASQKPANGESDTNGRPQKTDSELTDSGSETREAGSNIAKGGKV